MKNALKLGIIGLSEGNGHPYSWSAIFNGYNEKHMRNCPFPAIPEYLSKQNYPDDFLHEAKVTHIWTQDKELSYNIAKSANIDHIVKDFKEMIGHVDGVLLARDDAENHLHFSTPFLEAGLSIYIDKPIAHNIKELDKLFCLQKYEGQIFTCSALRFGREFEITDDEKAQIGEIKKVIAYTPKSWEKYAVHIIEPTLKMLNRHIEVKNHTLLKNQDSTFLNLILEDDTLLSFNSLGTTNYPITICIIGAKDYKTIEFKDSFTAFKKTLKCFINQIEDKSQSIQYHETMMVVKIIELGINN